MIKLGQLFDKLWNWIVYSSANPDVVSSTIKWFLPTVANLVVAVFGPARLVFFTTNITSVSDWTITAVQLILLVLTTIGTIVSLLRKIWLTIKGQNVQYSPLTGKAVRPAEVPQP